VEAHSIKPTFAGEVQLCSWSETHSGGAKIVLWLSDPSDLDAFRALTVRKGNTAGHRFMAVLVEVGDDEQPIQPPKQDEKESKGGALAKLAGMFCQQPEFWGFLGAWEGDAIFPIVTNADSAATAIRAICGVESRAELDSSTEAAAIFHEQIRLPFVRWKQGVRG